MPKRIVAIAVAMLLATATAASASLRSDIKGTSSSCIAAMLSATSGPGATSIAAGAFGTKADGNSFHTAVGDASGGYLPLSVAIAGAGACIDAIDAVMESHGASGSIWVDIESNDGSVGYFLGADGIGG